MIEREACDDEMTPEEIERALVIGPPDFLLGEDFDERTTVPMTADRLAEIRRELDDLGVSDTFGVVGELLDYVEELQKQIADLAAVRRVKSHSESAC